MKSANAASARNEVKPIQLEVNSLAPYFSGIDQNGNFQSLDRLSKKGPFVIMFYNGYWCNFCTDQLSEFQEGLDGLADHGFPIILVTPERKKYIEKTVKNTNVTFPILHDNLNYIMTKYKVAVNPPKSIADQIDLKKVNNSKEPLLPVPATYIVGKDGVIQHGHFSLDFTARSSFDKISAKVRELKELTC